MPRAGLDKETVIRAASEIVDSNGLDALVLAKLAKKLDVRTPSLYNHVKGLSDLKNNLAIYAFTLLYDRFTQAVLGKSKDEAVKALAETYIAFARTHPGLYEAMHRVPDEKDDVMQQAMGKVIEPVVQVFQSYGIEDELLSIHLVRGFRSLLHGFASLERQSGFRMPINPNESLIAIIDTFLKGIQSMVEQH